MNQENETAPNNDSPADRGAWPGAGAERMAARDEAQSPNRVMHTKIAELLDNVTVAMETPATPTDLRHEQPDPAVSRGDGKPTPAVADPEAHSDEPTGLLAAEAEGVRIRGRNDGVSIEIGTGDWLTLLANLDTRLEQAAGFFRGGQVALNVGARPLMEQELRQARQLLNNYGLALSIVRTQSERTFQSALNVGLAASLEGGATDQHIAAHPAESNQAFFSHFVYRGNLRSGQIVRREESLLIIGDVNPGAQVISAGDVLVWGRLLGVVHAGADGDEEAIVGGLVFAPTQLRIADLIAVAPGGGADTGSGWFRRGDASRPAEIAYIQDGRIVVAPWDQSRREGRLVLKRSVPG